MNAPQVEPTSRLREVHLREYWKVVWQSRWTVAAVFLLVVGLTAAYTFLQTPVYRAAATVEVQPQANRIAAGRDVSGLGVSGYGWFAEEKYHNTQVEIIKSRAIAQRVFDLFDLGTHPRFANAPDPVGAFRGLIQAIPRRETGLIEISIMGQNRDEITEWVNAVAKAYVDRNLQRAKTNVADALHNIKTELDKLDRDFRELNASRFQELTQDTQLSSEEQVEVIRERLRAYNGDLNETEIELSRLRDTLQRIRELQSGGADIMSLPELAEDQQLRELNQKKTSLELELESAKVELKPGHQEYQRRQSELAKINQRIQDRVSTILGTLQNKHDLAQEHAAYLRDEIDQAESMAVQVAQGRSLYELTSTRADTAKQIFDLIAKTMNEVQLGMQLLTNNVSILDPATPPLYPVRPRKKVNLLIGAMMGLFLGVALAFFLDYLDNTFRTPDDIEQQLGLAVLGVIPRMHEGGLANRAVKEAYQSLRTSVIFSSKNHRRRVILVTSTSPQEGKSSTVANLSRMLAAAGDRVIIADCDLRRPAQHLFHGLERDEGTTNYLAAPLDDNRSPSAWSAYVKSTDVAHLDVLTSGPIPPTPPDLLGSERFVELINALREGYDWVLIDSPPAATLADATLLASVADMTVLVVRHADTDRDLVRKTVQRLRAVNPNLAGVVLNNVDIERAYHKDYYYAGAYYYTDEERRRRKRRRVETEASVG